MASEDIYTEGFYIEEANRVKGLYENDFKAACEKMQSIYDDLSDNTAFEGCAKVGFLGAFEILLKHQKNVVEAMDGFYKPFEEFESNLDDIETRGYYKEVQI
ncbi:MAG: hypothetical protein ACK5LC_01990 [Coprobacillaceae bacterium]